MLRHTLAPNQFLNDYVLNCEICTLANISQNAYKFWKGVICANYTDSRTVFLYKKSIPLKYQNLIKSCSNLDGFVIASAFCSFTGLAMSHLTKSNKSNLYDKLQIKQIGKFKFVNLKKLYDDMDLPYSTRIYIEKCKYFSPTPLEKRIKLTASLCLGYY